jgi:hypothetical protein
MTGRDSRRAFSSRPSDPEAWVRSPASDAKASGKSEIFTARLTIDVTPDLRGRIKVAAFRRGNTVADMLRDLLVREFSNEDGGAT